MSYSSQDIAAIAAMDTARPMSMARKLEYVGFVFRSGGSFSYTPPIVGWPCKVPIPWWSAPVGYCAVYHTHSPHKSCNTPEFTSWYDMTGANKHDIPIYTGTPLGFSFLFDPRDKKHYQLHHGAKTGIVFRMVVLPPNAFINDLTGV